jgi:site-specific DNA-methyltransferase (adenine-specific)
MSDFQLYLGDCLEFMKGLPDGSVDAVVTDPPYGMQWSVDTTRFSGGAEDSISKRGAGRDYLDAIIGDDRPFDPTPFLVFPRVVMFGMNHFAARLPVGTTLVWIKRLDPGFGSFLSDAELAWMKGGNGVYCKRDLSMTAITRDREHPTQKPVSLMKWCMDKAGIPAGATVFDPYAGSGTTGVACMQTGRNFIGCEIDPKYFAIAKRRIENAKAQLHLFPSEAYANE